MRDLELYIHIPFCISKCKYCDFLSAPSTRTERKEYVESLCRRIRTYRGLAEAYRVVSIFVGGGTPSILEPGEIREIFLALRETFRIEEDAEISIEVNPGTVTAEKLETYRRVGVNRLSIGLQSACDRELKMLGRIHTFSDFTDTWEQARAAGFENINVDLMSAVPLQTLESWEDSLRTIAELGPEHISAYSLIIEEGTPFYERYQGGGHKEELPTEEEERQMYRRTKEILEEFGYHRYEISNYAKNGYECRHNLGYWERTEYLGIGTGAASLIGNRRWIQDETPETLGLQEQMEEFMFLGLRKIAGVSKKKFLNCFGKNLKDVYGETISDMCRKGLMEEAGDRVRLTDRGIDLANYVMSEFLLS